MFLWPERLPFSFFLSLGKVVKPVLCHRNRLCGEKQFLQIDFFQQTDKLASPHLFDYWWAEDYLSVHPSNHSILPSSIIPPCRSYLRGDTAILWSLVIIASTLASKLKWTHYISASTDKIFSLVGLNYWGVTFWSYVEKQVYWRRIIKME